jgi:soluble lytic murein transglycosylase
MQPRATPVLILFCALVAAPLAGAQAAPSPPANPPVPVPMPSAALRDAFDLAGRGLLVGAGLAAQAAQPLAGWLEYAALRNRLDTLPLTRGADFLARQRGMPVAAAFRTDWLSALARRNQWQAFLAAWDPTIDDPNLRCLRAQARMSLGQVDADWIRDVQTLWTSSGTSLPASCDAPFALLAAQGRLPDDLRWTRFDLATDAAQSGVMQTIARGMADADAAVLANRYAAYMQAADASASAWPKTTRSRKVAAAALARLARKDPDAAERLLTQVGPALGFDDGERGRVLYQIALWTVASYLPDSARRLANVPASAYDASLHEWRVREAIARRDWASALAALQAMPEAQRSDSRWTYLEARMRELTGDAAGAKALFAQAAAKPDFHGFLAADRLGRPYALCPWLPAPAQAAKQTIARDPALVRALQLFALDRRGWAQREWGAALSRMSDEQRRLAVEVAQDNGWFDRGVFGLVNVGGIRYPDEQRLYLLRFPLHHDASIRREAARQAIDPAWVAAEIRAESVFDPQARSSANARGLMQVVPATGAAVAARLGLPWAGGDSLYDADTNIAIGTAYLRQLLDRYGGKPYQVIAGYNAGPGPLGRWMAQRPDLDPDLWIETISYKETRDYVARVLAFSTLYDWRLQGDARRISDRMRGIVDGPRKGFACPAVEIPPSAVPAPAKPAKPSLRERRRR